MHLYASPPPLKVLSSLDDTFVSLPTTSALAMRGIREILNEDFFTEVAHRNQDRIRMNCPALYTSVNWNHPMFAVHPSRFTHDWDADFNFLDAWAALCQLWPRRNMIELEALSPMFVPYLKDATTPVPWEIGTNWRSITSMITGCDWVVCNIERRKRHRWGVLTGKLLNRETEEVRTNFCGCITCALLGQEEPSRRV